MKRLQLKTLRINNFKGSDEQEIKFISNVTTISGDNGVGKSRNEDAHLWLTTGKNKQGQADFNIKNTKDTSKNRLDHIAEEVYEITSPLSLRPQEVILKKIYRETWTKIRESEKYHYTGNSNHYFYNNAECATMREYNEKFNAIIPLEIFKQISDINYFLNEKKVNWQKRREILINLSGIISDSEIAKQDQRFIDLFDKLNGKSFEQYKKELNASKAKVQEQLDEIPIQIKQSNTHRIPVIDYIEIENNKLSLDVEKQKLNNIKEDKVKANKKELDSIIAKQNEKNQLQQKLNQLTNDNKNKFSLNKTGISGEIALCQSRIKKIESDLQIHKNDITNLNNSIKSLTEIVDLTREQWNTLNSEVLPPYDEAKCICPSCQQRLPEDKIQTFKETYKENYNKDKAKKLEDLRVKGKSNNSIIEKSKTEINNISQIISTLEVELESQKTILSGLNIDYEIESKKNYEPSQEEIELQKQVELFIIPEPTKIDNEEINIKIAEIENQIAEINKQLGTKDINKNIDESIKTLEKDEKMFAQYIADIEKEERVMKDFNKIKMQYVEDSVNNLFQYTTFKLFEDVISGEPKECCIAMYDGVPYDDANTGGKINMALDIINVLSNYYQYQAPVFIDNKESVGILIKTDLQIINMERVKGAPFTVTNN